MCKNTGGNEQKTNMQHTLLASFLDSSVENGVLHLSIIGCDPFLVGILSVVLLKSKLVSIVLGPWFDDT